MTLNEETTHPTEEPPTEENIRFPLLRIADLRARPKRKWLISKVIPEGTFSVLYGPYGCAKSFAVLDMCLCLVTGRAWHGHEVQHLSGRVIYIAAEGVDGIPQRYDAWKIENNMEAAPDLIWLKETPQLGSREHISLLSERLRADRNGEKPALIVFDTLARAMSCLDENLKKEMDLVVANAGRLQRAFGCHVMLIHHTGKVNNGPRGSVSLPAACETEILVTKENDLVTVTCIKQKDGKNFPELKLKLKEVELPGAESANDFTADDTSAVLVDCTQETTAPQARILSETERKVLEAFHSFPVGALVRNADLKASSGYKDGPLSRALKNLIKLGHITTHGEGSTKRYQLVRPGLNPGLPGTTPSGMYQGVAPVVQDPESLHYTTHPFSGVVGVVRSED